MEDPAPAVPLSPLPWHRRAFSPTNLAGLAAGLALGAAVYAAIWFFDTKPTVEASSKIYRATMDMWALYDLQMAHKKSSGVYANGLDALLATTKDGPALKARLAADVDLNTVAIVGNAERFKVELNVLDKQRTLVRMRGPIGKYLFTGRRPATLPERSSSDGMGKPIAR